jgi:hypothetical protein
MRMVPDVAAHADPHTGYRIFVGDKPYVIGGTSAATALYVGLFAAFGRKRGFITPELYKIQVCFNDIRAGDNGMFRAMVGPDPCTGIGSPSADLLAKRIGSDAAALVRVRRQLNEIRQKNINLYPGPSHPGLQPRLVRAATAADPRSIVYNVLNIGPGADPVQTDTRPLSDFGYNDRPSSQVLADSLDGQIQGIPGLSTVRVDPNKVFYCKNVGSLIAIVRQIISGQ